MLLAWQFLHDVQDDAPTTMAALTEFLCFPSFAERECSADKSLYLAFVDKPCERTQQFACDLG